VVWFSILILQSSGIIHFGKAPLPKGWVFSLTFLYSFLVFLGLQQKFPIENLYKLFLPTLIYIMVFNLVFAYDLYSSGVMVNRLEHFLGTLVLSGIVFVLITSLSLSLSL